jgi:group I intron endonuclease
MTKSPINYSNGKIYAIRNTINEQLYIGSTTQPLPKRMSWHRKSRTCIIKRTYPLYKAFSEYGIENFYIELIENYPCNSKEELVAREGYFIRKFYSFKNGYNKIVPNRTRQEYIADNKEIITQKKHEYNMKNSDKISAHNQQYKQKYNAVPENKDKVRQQQKKWSKERITCECGKVVSKACIYRHRKRRFHQQFVSNSV